MNNVEKQQTITTKVNPLVSIVVITYNSAKYVLETLESAKNQTYPNIELIVSDDASTDDTYDIVENWIDKNKDRFFSCQLFTTLKNTGVAGNLNRGVAACNGEWFKLCAGDDLLLENCIEDNIIFIKSKKEKVDLVSSKRIKFWIDHSGQERKIPSGPPSIFFHPDISVEDQYELALRNISPAINTWFIRTKIYQDIGGCDERFQLYEDGPLLLKLLNAGIKFLYLDKNTFLYRIHENSIFRKESNMLIYKKWIFQHYFPGRFEYFYPNLTPLEKKIFKYQFLIAKTTKKIGLNKRNMLTWVLNKIFTHPAEIIYNWNRNRFRSFYKKKYN